MKIIIQSPNNHNPLYVSIAETMKWLSSEVFINCGDDKSIGQFNLTKNDLVIFANDFLCSISTDEMERCLQKIPAKKIGIGFDDEYLLPTSIYLAQFMDLWITFDPVTHEYMRQINIKSSCIMHPIIASAKHISYKYDVSFIGNVDPVKSGRMKYVKRFSSAYPSSYFSSPTNKRLTDGEMYDVFASSKINLNFSKISAFNPYKINLPLQMERRGSKGRPYEIGASEGFCLSEFSPSIGDFLIPDHEIVFFDGVEEALDKTEYYLNNSMAREKIVRNLTNKVFRICSPRSPDNLFLTEIKKIISSSSLSLSKESGSTFPPPFYFEYSRIRKQFRSARIRTVVNLLKFLLKRISMRLASSYRNQ